MNKIREEVKKAVVNVADQNRRVGRNDLGTLWRAFAKAGGQFVQSEKEEAIAAQRAATVAQKAVAKAARGKRALAKQGRAARRQLFSKYQDAVREMKANLAKF
jgi:hypothetical protein